MPFKAGNKHGKGGARANAGRKSDKTREVCLLSFETRVDLLCQIIDDANNRASDRIRAIALLASIGLSGCGEYVEAEREASEREQARAALQKKNADPEAREWMEKLADRYDSLGRPDYQVA